MEKMKIGYDAGKIWHIISHKKSVKVLDLKESTKMDVKDIFLALGWPDISLQFVEMSFAEEIR